MDALLCVGTLAVRKHCWCLGYQARLVLIMVMQACLAQHSGNGGTQIKGETVNQRWFRPHYCEKASKICKLRKPSQALQYMALLNQARPRGATNTRGGTHYWSRIVASFPCLQSTPVNPLHTATTIGKRPREGTIMIWCSSFYKP